MDENIDPIFRAPANACDAHFHVFGAEEKYPYRDPKLRYKPPFAPLEKYMAKAKKIGLERFVIVQPSAYGRDNSCMLDAMKVLGERSRGIVDVDENVNDAELERLNGIGVRGIRVNVSPVHPFEEGLIERMLPRIDRLEARCREIGWQLDFLGPGWLTHALLDRLSKLQVDFTLAHMGMFLAKDGPDQPGFQRLLDLLRHGDGRCWIKLTAVYRMSQAPGYADVPPMLRALIDAAPDRLIWGSDDPHASFSDKAGSIELYNLLCTWVPDDAMRHRILVDNPAQLYGF